MTTTSYGFGVRRREPHSARRLPSPITPSVAQMLARADAVLAAPYSGVTTDGHVLPGLYTVHRTGVSTEPLTAAAEAFLAGLDSTQRAATCFSLEADAWGRWNNTHSFVMRHGQLLEALDGSGRERALALVQASLSAHGYTSARNVMRLNHTIGEITGSWDEYGEWVYWLSVFGTPGPDQPWGWQIDGHHLNLNCLVLADQVVLTPMFMGSEPTRAETGQYIGTRVFEAEEGDGLRFVRSLRPAQLEQALPFRSLSEADAHKQRERWQGDGRIQGGALMDNLTLPYAGIRATELSTSQQQQLLQLAEVYVGRIRAGHDQVKMDEVREHLAETHFVWFGGTDDDSVFYYRIHSPVLLIEFDHLRGIALDNDSPSRAHIHTVVRTPNGNDYGRDLLRQHYAHFHRGEPDGRLTHTHM